MSSENLNPTSASLLGFLDQGPMTGWDLDRAVASSIGNFWNVTRSQIYRELRALAAAGLVRAGESGPRDRVPYAVTEAGRAAFRRWISERPGPDLIRSRLLLTVFFGAHLDPGRLAELLADHRRSHAERLRDYEALSAASDAMDNFPRATLRFGLAYERAMVEWLDSVMAELGTAGGADI